MHGRNTYIAISREYIDRIVKYVTGGEYQHAGSARSIHENTGVRIHNSHAVITAQNVFTRALITTNLYSSDTLRTSVAQRVRRKLFVGRLYPRRG